MHARLACAPVSVAILSRGGLKSAQVLVTTVSQV